MTNKEAFELNPGDWVVTPGRKLAKVTKIVISKPDIQVWVIMPDGRETYWHAAEIGSAVDTETSS